MRRQQDTLRMIKCRELTGSIRGTEGDTKSPAHALIVTLTLISESGPKVLCSPYPRSERKSLGGCRTFGVSIRIDEDIVTD